ncbi:ribosomal protein S5 domain 2-type protein [Blyttiomyces helicus]|uniref:Ribosomal RNA-processing protein 42 n=1 Tax=Blyttiomyces helicus TaxID=388810 RepID=A0A4V1IQL7_9FUNG|nr:ribosomal protein S5 domain 2-type protein [Blyttiomyces helicus]|eukprot:RKO86997.1 ribosomal protein S5 domain 2-type protein [Blyttiomyces helicus]
MRDMRIETGMITQASGSCRVSIDGGTDVLVGVKVEVASIEPDANAPGDDGDVAVGEEGVEEGVAGRDRDRGRIACTVECSPSATRVFDPRDVEEMSNEFSQLLERVLNGPHGGIDLKALCIVPGSTCWVLNIDALVLDYGGNLLDAIFLAIRGALHNTRIPRATVEYSDGHVEFEIADEETEIVKGWEDVPVGVTMNKIGSRHIVDATPIEELCAAARLTVAVNRRGNVCAVQKGGKGGIEPSLLAEMVQSSKHVGSALLERIDAALRQEVERIERREDPVGFRH